MSKRCEYVSIFKIGGHPILPPLLDDKCRKEMQSFREKAINLEKQLENNTKDAIIIASTCEETSYTITKLNDEDDAIKTKIRRNSYTVESPSPLLVAAVGNNCSTQNRFSRSHSDISNFKRVSNIPLTSLKKLKQSKTGCDELTVDVSDADDKGDSSDMDLTPPVSHPIMPAISALVEDSQQQNKQLYVALRKRLDQKHQAEYQTLISMHLNNKKALDKHFALITSLVSCFPHVAPLEDIPHSPGSPSSISPQLLQPLSGEVRVQNGIADESHIKNKMSPSKAAEIITAGVKGYLTRRLFKTQRVTDLVKILKDCLYTALVIQAEDHLSLSDMQFQSRILQQLTVAFNDLHIIFSLPSKERMEIIAADRKKKSRELPHDNSLHFPITSATRRYRSRKSSYMHEFPEHERRERIIRRKSTSSDISYWSVTASPNQKGICSFAGKKNNRPVVEKHPPKPWR